MVHTDHMSGGGGGGGGQLCGFEGSIVVEDI